MLIVMKPQATEEDVRRVCRKIESMGYRPHPMPGAQRTAIGITGNPGPLEPAEFDTLPGVAEAIPVSKPYKLVSREVKNEDSVIRVKIGDSKDSFVTFGGRELAVIAGPCAIESREQAFAAAEKVRKAALDSSVAARSSLAPRLTASRASARVACACWRRRARRPGCRSSRS